MAELDIRANAYISEKYIESSAGRLDTYKQIAEIASVGDYKRVYSSLEETYGPLPQAVINLLVVAVLKSYAAKFNVRKITVAKGLGALEFPSLEAVSYTHLSLYGGNPSRLYAQLSYKGRGDILVLLSAAVGVRTR